MHPHDLHIERALAEGGWRVVERFDAMLWWIAEVWRIESVWSPIGLTQLVVFLVEPQARSGAPSHRHVWAVGVCREIPDDRLGPWEAEMTLGNAWRDQLPGFMLELQRLRRE